MNDIALDLGDKLKNKLYFIDSIENKVFLRNAPRQQ